MSSFIFSLNATVPVFAVIVIGNLLCKIGLIDEHFASISNKFVFRACLPCMIFLDLADTSDNWTYSLSQRSKFRSFCARNKKLFQI